MRKSFYTWLMTQRNPKSHEPVAILADLVFDDTTFPKHTDNFETISRYLEDEADFAFNQLRYKNIEISRESGLYARRSNDLTQ